MTLNYTEYGKATGETIVYLHGAGLAAWSWKGVTELLPQYHNIAVDLPGHGASNQVEVGTLAEMAHRVADFITTIAPNGKAHVVGLSLGGITTIEMMRHRSEVIQTAIVSGVNAIPLSFMTKMMLNITIPFLKNDFMIRQNARMYQLDDESTVLYFTSMKQFDIKTFKNIVPEIVTYEPAKYLTDVTVPVLFVAGENEVDINIKSVSLLANAINNSVGVLAPNVHHGWSAENPPLFADMIDHWISRKEIAEDLDIKVDTRHEKILV